MDLGDAMSSILCLQKGKYMGIVILAVYVDGIVITGNDGDEIDKLKAYMTTEFESRILELNLMPSCLEY